MGINPYETPSSELPVRDGNVANKSLRVGRIERLKRNNPRMYFVFVLVCAVTAFALPMAVANWVCKMYAHGVVKYFGFFIAHVFLPALLLALFSSRIHNRLFYYHFSVVYSIFLFFTVIGKYSVMERGGFYHENIKEFVVVIVVFSCFVFQFVTMKQVDKWND